MQKINQLAKQMVQHGVVPDIQEATKQAELMINRGDKGISDVMNIETDSSGEELSFDKKEKMNDLSADLRMLKNELNDQAKTIKGLADQLEQVKNDMGKLKGFQQPRPVMMKEPQREQTELRKEEKERPKPDPKVGGFDSDDVSIEKYFYSGPPKG